VWQNRHVAIATKIWKATPFVAKDNSSYRNLDFSMSQRVVPIEGGIHVATDYYGANRDMNFCLPKCFQAIEEITSNNQPNCVVIECPTSSLQTFFGWNKMSNL
jgi:hypothetical protein